EGARPARGALRPLALPGALLLPGAPEGGPALVEGAPLGLALDLRSPRARPPPAEVEESALRGAPRLGPDRFLPSPGLAAPHPDPPAAEAALWLPGIEQEGEEGARGELPLAPGEAAGAAAGGGPGAPGGGGAAIAGPSPQVALGRLRFCQIRYSPKCRAKPATARASARLG